MAIGGVGAGGLEAMLHNLGVSNSEKVIANQADQPNKVGESMSDVSVTAGEKVRLPDYVALAAGNNLDKTF